MIQSMLDELTTIQNGISDPLQVNIIWNSSTKSFDGKYGMASYPAFQSAVNSGLYRLLPQKSQENVATMYYRLEHFNYYIDQVLKFYCTPIYLTDRAKEGADNLIGKVNENVETVIILLGELIPELESAKIPKTHPIRKFFKSRSTDG